MIRLVAMRGSDALVEGDGGGFIVDGEDHSMHHVPSVISALRMGYWVPVDDPDGEKLQAVLDGIQSDIGSPGERLLFGPSKQVKWRFPWIQAAIDFLSAKKVIPASAFAGLSLDEQQAAFTAPGIEDPSDLRALRDEIAGGVKEGESYANFQKRVGDGLALTRAQTETVFRTNIHQGYVGGFETGTEAPAVADAFPAVMFSATRDNRVRETHWELDGFCCLKTDPAYQVLLRALKDWNCRCNPIPMSLKQAEAVGLKTFADLPADVVERYGAGLAPAAV